MKLELQVIAASSIKRKKPWPRIAWVGEMQESILLIDQRRLSILYLPSGKTKRRLSQLHPLLPQVSVFHYSDNGHFLCALLRSGDVFLWHKDTNTLKFIEGLPVFSPTVSDADKASANEGTQIYISDTGCELLVVPPSGRCLYLWQKGRGESILSQDSSVIKGEWVLIRAPGNVAMPSGRSAAARISAVFVLDDVMGRSCCCSFVFPEESAVVVTSVWLRWNSPDVTPYTGNNLRCDWNCIKYSGGTILQEMATLRMSGSLVAAHARDGRLLAVAINSSSSHGNRMLYVSTISDMVVIADMKGCGAKNQATGQAARMYWVEDLQWTWDDLFLVCMIGQGSLCMLPRLGEPVLLRSYGFSLDMGPRYFLPVHPLVSIPGVEQRSDILRQRFTVAAHPRLPLFLCSDGYVVTAFQLPGEMSCLNLLKGLTMEAGSLMKHIKVKRRFSEVMAGISPDKHRHRNQARDLKSSGGHKKAEQRSTVYEFETPENEAALDEDSDDEIVDLVTPHSGSGSRHMPEQGQVVIGDTDNMNTTQELLETAGGTKDTAEAIEKAYSALSHAWTLAASHSGLWTQHHEDATLQLMRHICSLITLILNCDSKTAEMWSRINNVPASRAKFSQALTVLQQFLSFLKLDSISCNLLLTTVQMTHHIVKTFMKLLKSEKQDSQLHRLHGCYLLILYMERSLTNVYSSKKSRNTSSQSFADYSDVREPNLFCPSQAKSSNSSAEREASRSVDDGSREPSREMMTYLAIRHSSDSAGALSDERNSLACKLLPVWRRLYKQVVHEWHKSVAGNETNEARWTLRKMLVALQCKLHVLGFSVASRKICRVKPAKQLFIEGCLIPATQSWLQQLNKLKDLPEHRLEHILHSILYTLILQKELRQVVEFVEILIRHDDTQSAAALFRQDQQTKLSVLSLVHQKTPPDIVDPPPSYIHSVAVLQLVQSLGRIMAAYFTNSTAFVYPPHQPRRIPPLHLQLPINERILPLYSSHLSTVICQAGLDRVWTVERCMEYLVISGLFSEAVWFSLRLGDWKTAFVISSVCEHRLAWHKERGCTKDFLKYYKVPEGLGAGAIMKEQIQLVLSTVLSEDKVDSRNNPMDTEASELKRYMHDMVLGCTVMGVNVTPWLLETLIRRAKTLFSQLSPLVPDGFYLPAPPVYCPQPALPEQSECSEEVYREFLLRSEIHHVLQCILLALSASNCLLPSARWYLTRVLQALEMAASDKREEFVFSKEDMAFLAGFLEDVKSPFQGEENDPIIHDVLASFRDVCSLLWMAHARDSLSKAARAKSALAEQMFQDSDEWDHSAWTSACYSCLMWATSLSVFCDFLAGQEDIYGLLLSVIMELPATVEVAMTLAVHLPDADELPPDTESKLQVLLKSWQGVFLGGERSPRGNIKVDGHPGKAPRGTSLSVFYLKQAEKVRHTLRKKQKMFGMYETQVFALQDSHQGVENGINYIGARPFESEPEFLNFLDMFYAICLNKEVDKINEKRHLKPFLVPFMEDIRVQELDFMAYKAVANLQKRQNLSSGQNTPFKLSLQLSKMTRGQPLDSQPPSKYPRRGLFRSRSFNDVYLDWGSQLRGPQMGLVVDQRSISHPALDSVDVEPQRTPKEHYRQKLRSKSAGRPKDLVAHVSVPLKRSPSMDSQLSQEERASDPLSKPLFSAPLLDAMVFGSKYDQVESLVDWLSMWSGKHHKLNVPEKMTPSPAMHINMHRRLMVYALWEVEHFYYPRWGPSRVVQVPNETLHEQTLSAASGPGWVPSSADGQKRKAKKAKHKPPKTPKQKSSRLNDSRNNNDPVRALATSPEEEEQQRNFHEFVNLDDSEKPEPKKKSKSREPPRRQLSFAPEERRDVDEYRAPSRQDSFENLLPRTETEGMRETVLPHSIASESSLNVSSLNEEDLKPIPRHSSIVHVDTPDAVTTELKPFVPEEKQGVENKQETNNKQDIEDKKNKQNMQDMKEKQDVQDMKKPEDVDGGQLNDLAGTLREIIRHEMTRVMKAQYEGIMNGLGALDDDDDDDEDNKKKPQKKKQQGKTEKDLPFPGPDESKDRSSTDFDVTPLPSDDPLTMSELERQPVRPPQMNYVPLRPQHQPLGNLLHPGQRLLGPYSMNSPTHRPAQSPSGASHPPLLRLPTTGQRVHFPALMSPPEPRVVWHEPAPATQSLPRMPSMQQRHLPDEVPVRDTNGLRAVPHSRPSILHPANRSDTRHFPLLHMPGRTRRFSHIEDDNGVPRLVSPQDIMDFQKQRRDLDAEKQWEDAKMKERIAQIRPKSHSGQDSDDHRLNTSWQADRGDKEEMWPEMPVQRLKRPQRNEEVQEEETEEEDDVDEESVEVHPGHALTPGLFDEYLKKGSDENEEQKETFAEVQLKVASMLKVARKNEAKRDTSMQTDPTMVHAGTTFTQESGTDPIQEAIENYTRARRDLGAGGLLPPELFLGLQFPNQRDSHRSARDANGRAFINVVDLQGRALDDLITNIQEREEQVGLGRAEDLKEEGRALTQDNRVPEAIFDERDDDVPTHGPDSVTERVLGKPSGMGGDEVPSGSQVKSKTKRTIRGRLDDMELQIDSMERMAQNMEEEYKNTKLLVHTIERIGEAIDPSEMAEPSARVLHHQTHSPPTKDQPARKPLKPSDVQRFKMEDKDASKMRGAAVKHIEDGLTPKERLREIRANLSMRPNRKEENETVQTDDLDDTLGGPDAVANNLCGDTDLTSLELSTRRSRWNDDRIEKDVIESIVSPENEKTEKRSEEEKQRLQKYIAQKRAERMRQFCLKQEELREREVKPFQATAESAKLSTKELEEKENQRIRGKLSREQEFALRRQHLANKMMGDLLSDRLNLPPDPPVMTDKMPSKKKSASRSAAKGPKHSSPVRSQDKVRPHVGLDDLSEVHASHERFMVPSRDHKVRWSDDNMLDDIRTGTDSFTGAYTRQLEHMQTDTWESGRPSTAPSDVKQQKVKPSPIPEESDSVPTTKPFHELVRLQRPELTRKGKGFKTQPLSYTDRLANLSRTFAQRSSGALSSTDQRSALGSTRTVGLSNAGVRRAPRTVKTYTQRLQEMKQARHAAGPVAWQPRYVADASTNRPRTAPPPLNSRIKRRKPKKPLTYAEQLQRLQPPKELYRAGQGHLTSPAHGVQRRRRYKPAHKPKTYTQQLQELQPNKATVQTQPRSSVPSRPADLVLRTSLNRGLRSRPYTDPYMDEDEVSVASAASAWHLDDNIKKLLYDDQASYTEGMSVATGGDISDLAELEYLAGEDYASRVSINEIAEVKSMSSGSIMSFIDWDQVEELIADVH